MACRTVRDIMDKQKLEDYYFERNSTIFSEMLDEDENYQRLKKPN